MNRPYLLQRLLSRQPSAIPTVPRSSMGPRTLSYAQLEAESNSPCPAPHGRRGAEGDRVGIYLDKSARSGDRDLRGTQGGCVYVPLDPGAYDTPGLHHRDCEIALLVSELRLAGRWPELVMPNETLPIFVTDVDRPCADTCPG
jgi:acyl-coenzyme A synthetase/AMP-(fatty) acid ligase